MSRPVSNRYGARPNFCPEYLGEDMGSVRNPVVAGQFYPGRKEELSRAVNELLPERANKKDAIKRLHEIVNAANQVKPMRYATRPSYGSKQRRLESKTQRGQIKQMRGKIASDKNEH